MEKAIKVSNKSSNKKEYKSWRKSVEKDGVTKSVSVDECENGFIISVCEYGDGNKGWYDDTKKYISTKNPLEGQKEYKETIDTTKKIMAAIEALGL